MSKLFKIGGFLAFVMTIVVIAAINVNVAFQERGLSDLSLATLEVLAKNEEPGGSMMICCETDTDYYCAIGCSCGALWVGTENSIGRPVGLMGTCGCGKSHNTDCGRNTNVIRSLSVKK